MSSQKRKRSSQSSPRAGGEEPPPPPFAPARAALARSYAGAAPRRLQQGPSQPVVNAAVAAAARLCARDFAGAAALMPLLLRRLRARRGLWFVPREGVAVGAEVLRRGRRDGGELESFLGRVVRDVGGGYYRAREGEGYGGRVREVALLEVAAEMVATGRLREALEVLRGECEREPFRGSALVWAYIGVLGVVLAADEDDATALLSTAGDALDMAAKLDPSAHCFVHYAAAAAVAAGDVGRAVGLQKRFVERNPGDAMGLRGYLAALKLQAKTAEVATRAERVDVARRLVQADPVSSEGLAVLQEALAWAWELPRAVDLVEVAEVVAGRIECGAGEERVWGVLLGLLKSATEAEIARFMFGSGREAWWANHFFRPARAAWEVGKGVECAKAKMGVARVLFGECEYVMAVAAAVGEGGGEGVESGWGGKEVSGREKGGAAGDDKDGMAGIEFHHERSECEL